MSSVAPGPSTSVAEVTNVSRHGFWLLLGDFPWFASAAIGELMNVEWPSPEHLYWPVLDVDLSVESIRHPERFPLVSRVTG
jgi:hypothetical protein